MSDVQSMDGSQERRHYDGSAFERLGGYARAVRAGAMIAVSGTIDDRASEHPADTYAQTSGALEKALSAVYALGGTARDVIRTRIHLAPRADWREAARAHVDVFGDIHPANTTLFAHAFIPPDAVVEVELDAYLHPETSVDGSLT